MKYNTNIYSSSNCFFVVFVFITLVLIQTSCFKKEIRLDNLNGNKIISLGHGGMGIKSKYPLNCLESIQKCLSTGAQGSEFDVQLTKDSVLIAFHNEKLEDNTKLNGLVNSMNWYDLKESEYCKKRFKNYALVSVEEIFDNVTNLNEKYFSFDCKIYPNPNNRDLFNHQFANAIVKILDKYNLHSNCFIETQSADLIELLQKKSAKQLKLFFLTHNYSSGFEEAKRLNAFGISISNDKITRNQIEEAHQNNLFVALWDVRTNRDNKNAVNKSPDIIQSDEIKDLLREVR